MNELYEKIVALIHEETGKQINKMDRRCLETKRIDIASLVLAVEEEILEGALRDVMTRLQEVYDTEEKDIPVFANGNATTTNI